MSLIPPLSPLMENARSTIKSSLEESFSHLDSRIFESYLDGIKSEVKDEHFLNDFSHWVLHHYFLLSGYLQATVYYGNTAMYSFGSSELLKNQEELLKNNTHLSYLQLTYRENDKFLLIRGTVSSGIEGIAKKITEMDIIPFCKNMYFFTPSLNDEKKLDIYTPLKNHLSQILDQGLEEYSSVCFSHFRFRSLHVFFEFLGQQNSTEMTDKIMELLNKYFKNSDSIFQLSPVSYLVISPGITSRKIQNRFQGIYFQVRSIILDYELFTSDYDTKPASYAEIWEELKI